MHTQIEDSALTPEFAAPEQLLGEMPSTATDVYQLGMLLYVLLTDGHPLQLMGTRAERIKAALAGRIGPASQFARGSALRKELKGDLDAILAKALDSDASRRYPTAAALHEELARYLNGEPVSARRGATLYQMRKFVSRHRLAVALSAAALAALCAVSIVAVEQARKANRERDQAMALAARDDAINDFLSALITEAAGSDNAVTVNELIARSERLALLDSSGNKESRAAILNLISQRYLQLGDGSKAAELSERALALLGDSSANGLHAKFRCEYALTIAAMGRSDEALRIITAELEHPPSDSGGLAECLAARAGLALDEGDADTGLRYALESVAAVRSGGPISIVSEASFLQAVAQAYRMQGRYREALDYYERTLHKLAEVGREWSDMGLITRGNFAFLLDNIGVPRRSLQLHDDSMNVLTKRDPGAALPLWLLANRGRALESLGRFEQARASYQGGLEVSQAAQNPEGQILCLAGLARTAIEARDLVTAKGHLDRAMQLFSSPGQIERYSSVALGLGTIALAEGRLDEARQRFEQAAAKKSNLSVVISGELGKAEVALQAGDPTSAARDARAALDATKPLQGAVPYSQLIGRSWLMLGRALQKLGDDKQAHEAMETAVRHLSNTVDDDHPLLVQARSLMGESGAKR
jgi:tetratricopeptide (TPR) repeat protein